jgi:hypothetical protein
MVPRLIALGALAFVLALGVVGVTYAAAQLQFAGQAIGLSGTGLTSDSAEQQRFLIYFSIALQSTITPLASAALLAVAAILAVLARRSQLRRGRLRRRALAR